MAHNQRDRGRPLALGPEKMDRHAVDAGAEMIEAVHRRFLGAPVIAVAPTSDEIAQIAALHAVAPILVGKFLRPARAGEPVAEIGELGVGDRDTEALDRHA